MKKEMKEILMAELRRLNQLNHIYQKYIEENKYDNEPELIVENIKAMCQIAKII